VSSGWITSHGFALNLSTNLGYFETIIPCGIPDESVTSLEAIKGYSPPLPEVAGQVAKRFAEVFERTLEEGREGS
jgi:lipoyl(octanoyl) transferase